MQISGEYGTELLLRYSEEETARKLERRRVAEERAAESGGAAGESKNHAGAWFARLARFVVRGDTAAGGPLWIRPDQGQAARPERISEPAVAAAALNAPSVYGPQGAGEQPVGQEKEHSDDDERMPSPALVGAATR